jgi:hypothetical protein
MRKLIRSWLLPGLVLIAVAGAGPVAAATSPGSGGTAVLRTAVEICGEGPAVVRPASMILTCADAGEIAKSLHWTSWAGAKATATGLVTWLTGAPTHVTSRRWDSAAADFTLADPVTEAGGKVLFTKLDVRVTGRTPNKYMRDVTYSEAPPAITSLPRVPGPQGQTAPTRPTLPRPAAASGTLGFAQIEGNWVLAGGPRGNVSTIYGRYPAPAVAAVLTYYEASYAPGNIQLGQPYSTTGWGLWQITPGDSGNLTYGEDYQILDPWNNAEQAALKCLNAAGETYGCWTPWSTYTDPWYQEMPNPIPAPDTDLTDPGQYVPYSDYTGFAHNRSEPGSTYGPPMPNSAIADVFWKGATEDHGEDHGLFQALGPADKTLSGPNALGYGPLGSAPSAGVDGAGNAYVYWRGANKDLYEAYWDGSGWVGPVNRGMGPMGSQPGVAISSNGTAYVFWEGATANHGLFEATGPADGALYGPIPLGYGPLGSAPSAGVDSNGNVYVFWEGATADHGLFEAYYNGSAWSKNPIDQRMGPLGSQPTVAIHS